jgi:hypothetical protein
MREMNTKTLFIGGPKDGTRSVVEDRQFIRVLTPKSWTASVQDSPTDVAVSPYNEFSYRVETLAAGEERHRVYVIDSMTIEQAIVALLEGYKKP